VSLTSVNYKRRFSCAGFSLIEILLVLLIIGLIVGVASLSIDNRSGFNRRIALKEFGNQLNMVLSEAALSGKTWGLRIEKSIDDAEIINYHWLKLDEEQRWSYAAPYELEERTALPDETMVTLVIDNEVVAIETELADNNKDEENNDKKSDEENPLQPQIVLQANGEVTPFILNLAAADNTDSNNPGLELKVDSLGRLTLPSAEE
jgi:general secretion pathway protein H